MSQSPPFWNNERIWMAWYGVCAFVYAMLAMILLREIVIPRVLQSNDGHVLADPFYYHQIALEQLDLIRSGGWPGFVMHPKGQGIAGYVSILYMIWDNPYSVVFSNAIMHALSVVLMVLIIKQWFPIKISVAASVPLFLSPYMILWYSQVNKESISIMGALLIMYGLINLANYSNEKCLKDQLVGVLFVLAGALCLWIVRPYLNQMLVPFVFLFGFAILLKLKHKLLFIITLSAVVGILSYLSSGAASTKTLEYFYNYSRPISGVSKVTISERCLQLVDRGAWVNMEVLPNYINDRVRAMTAQRCLIYQLLETQDNQATLSAIIDQDLPISGTKDALLYLPRALQLGLFYPGVQNLSFFSSQKSMFYLISIMESLLFVVSLLGLVIYVLFRREVVLTFVFLCSAGIVTAYGYSTPFLGALYRYRYPWWEILMCLGFAVIFNYMGKFSLVSAWINSRR